MAITSVNERSEGRQTGIAEGNIFTFITVFLVISDSVSEAPANVLNASGVPTIGDVHPTETSAFVTNKSVEQTDSRNVYLVNVNYQTRALGGETGDNLVAENPTDEDPVITWSLESETVVIESDIKFQPIDNTNGELFDPPLTKNKNRLQINITRNEKEEQFDPIDILLFVDTINENAMFISGLSVPAKVARIVEISAQSRQFNSTLYWEVNYRIVFDPEEWILKILNQGFTAKTLKLGASGDNIVTGFIPIRDIDGKKVKKPVLLTEEGFVKKEVDKIHEVPFDIYTEIDFKRLGLPE